MLTVLFGEQFDVFGKSGNKTIAVECGGCKITKLKDLEGIFDRVEHIPYGTDIGDILGYG